MGTPEQLELADWPLPPRKRLLEILDGWLAFHLSTRRKRCDRFAATRPTNTAPRGNFGSKRAAPRRRT